MINWKDLQQKIGDKTQIALNEAFFFVMCFRVFFFFYSKIVSTQQHTLICS